MSKIAYIMASKEILEGKGVKFTPEIEMGGKRTILTYCSHRGEVEIYISTNGLLSRCKLLVNGKKINPFKFLVRLQKEE